MTETPPSSGSLRAEDWAGARGTQWLAHLDHFERMLAPAGAALLEHAAFKPGETVVDIGCGGGGTSLEIARAVGLDGAVLGLDISADLVAAAGRRAAQAGLANIRFEAGDAATSIPADAPFDRLFSRFGCMFFGEPYEAYANLHRMLRPGGRIDLGVWAPAAENDWMMAIAGVIGRHVALPEPVPRAPGPCALDDPDYIRDLLGRSGFADVTITPWTGELLIGGAGTSPDEAVRFALDGFSICELLHHSDPETRDRATADLHDLFEQRLGDQGIAMAAKTWMVTARA